MKLFGKDRDDGAVPETPEGVEEATPVDPNDVPASLVDWYLDPYAPSPVTDDLLAGAFEEGPASAVFSSTPPSASDPHYSAPPPPTGFTPDDAPPPIYDPAASASAGGLGDAAQVFQDVQQVIGESTPQGPAGLPAVFEQPPLTEDLLDLKELAQRALGERLGQSLYESSLSDEELRGKVIQELAGYLTEQDTSQFTTEQLEQLGQELVHDILGHGPIEPLLQDESVTEVMVNGPDSVFVERNGRLTETVVRFDSDAHVRRVIDRIVSRIGRRVDESSPMVDARLPDGSRVNAIIPPLAIDGSSITIRKFAKRALDETDLVNYGSLSWDSVALLKAFVKGRLNILISGGTGSGKTTLLNVCSNFIPEGERIVTIEDAAELRLNQRHVVRLESRPANVEGKGAVHIRDLVKNSLRMRPDRIVVGECRGGEALDMLQAMNTGHEGSLSTLHANNPRDTISRLETLVLMAGMDLPIRAIREQIASAVDVIVQLTRLRDGTRRVTYITEVVGMEGDTITLSDIFTFDYEGVDEEGRYIGDLRPTGLRPMVIEKLAEHGIELPASTFGDTDVAADIDFSQL